MSIRRKRKRCKVDQPELRCFTAATMRLKDKTTCETRCFTIETAVGGCEGRWCQTAVAGYGRLWSPMHGYTRLWSDRSDIEKRNCRLQVGFRRRWVAALLGNAIVGCTPCSGGFQLGLGCSCRVFGCRLLDTL